MNHLQKGIITLLKSAVTGEKLPLPEEFCLEEADSILKKQSLIPLACEGAYRCGIDPAHPLMQRYKAISFRNLMYSEQQLLTGEAIFRALEENQIDYLPLKGVNMKKLYPRPELRVMGDADILIHPEDHPRIAPLMEQLGFRFQTENEHIFEWHSEKLHVELHKCLVPPSDEDYHAYYATGWQLAKPTQTSRWNLSDEDTLVFYIAHFARHYRVSGIGCRHVVDLFVYLRANPALDMVRVREELEKLGLLEFYNNIRRLLEVWFEDGEPDPVTELITAWVFSGGNWGTPEHGILLREVRKAELTGSVRNAKGKAVWGMIFPSLSTMCYQYPTLVHHRWLLPLFWVVRWFDILLNRRKKIQKKVQILRSVSNDSIEFHRQTLRAVGLRFESGKTKE